MNYHVILHPEALKELEVSVQWYENRAEGLGLKFIASVHKKLKDIAAQPDKYAKKIKNYREVGVDVFPYVIIYEVLMDEQKVFIHYIFHNRRNPKLKYRRKP